MPTTLVHSRAKTKAACLPTGMSIPEVGCWDTFSRYSKAALVHKLKEYCTSQGLPFHTLMVLDNAPAHPHVLQDLHSDIKFVFLPSNTTSLLQPMDQGVIQMFKTHYLQKTRHALSLKCDVPLSELEKATQAPAEREVEFLKNVVRCHWWEFTIRNAIWHDRDAWKEVTQSCIHGGWKKLCLQYVVDFRGFDLAEKLSEERLKCLELVKKVGLDELEEEDVNSFCR